MRDLRALHQRHGLVVLEGHRWLGLRPRLAEWPADLRALHQRHGLMILEGHRWLRL